jgi:hypothetical protein
VRAANSKPCVSLSVDVRLRSNIPHSVHCTGCGSLACRATHAHVLACCKCADVVHARATGVYKLQEHVRINVCGVECSERATHCLFI